LFTRIIFGEEYRTLNLKDSGYSEYLL
jgi:hypothetical protein